MATPMIQESFAAGELSTRLRARFGTDVYARGLDYCENFRVLPQGPILMRAGTQREGLEINAPRLIPFRVPGVANDYVLAITPLKLRIYERGVGLVSIKTNKLSNGHFDTNFQGWLSAGVTWAAPGVAHFAPTYGLQNDTNLQPLAAGVQHTIRFKYRGKGTLRADVDYVNPHDYAATGAFQDASFVFTPAGPAPVIAFAHKAGYAADDYLEIDDVSVVSSADPGVTELAAPWGVTTLDLIQHAQSLVAAQMIFAHPAKMPRVLQRSEDSVWELYEAAFTSPPTAWRDGAAPGTVEVGFQGRTWYGGTPNVPNGLWGSKSGQPFNLDLDNATPDDALDLLISAKGTVRWVQAQKSLLVGTDATEHALTGGGNGVIKPTNYEVSDESAYGSAPVQAVHIGDQVVFVSYDRRHLRAMNYDLQANGWVSKALTFLAEHITKDGIREVHFVRSPDPTLIAVLFGGKVVACTYDRSQEVIAWYRLNFDGIVVSAAVAESEYGPELWIADGRGGGYWIERMPMHEINVSYLDASVSKIVEAGGIISGLNYLNGKTVTVATNDTEVQAGVLVADGQVVIADLDYVGEMVTVGLPYVARAVTLPKNVKGGKVRAAKLGAILNDSALPKFNNVRPPERSPKTGFDAPNPRITGKVEVGGKLGWDGEGKITIEQDRPFRTEILGLFENTQANDQ